MRHFNISAILLLVTIAIFSCSKKDAAPSSSSAFTATVTEDFMNYANANNIDCWLFISSRSGQILGSNQITASGTYNFNTTNNDDSISMTEFFRFPNSGGAYLNAYSRFIKRNSTMLL